MNGLLDQWFLFGVIRNKFLPVLHIPFILPAAKIDERFIFQQFRDGKLLMVHAALF
jgi:hypothetical protein